MAWDGRCPQTDSLVYGKEGENRLLFDDLIVMRSSLFIVAVCLKFWNKRGKVLATLAVHDASPAMDLERIDADLAFDNLGLGAGDGLPSSFRSNHPNIFSRSGFHEATISHKRFHSRPLPSLN